MPQLNGTPRPAHVGTRRRGMALGVGPQPGRDVLRRAQHVLNPTLAILGAVPLAIAGVVVVGAPSGSTPVADLTLLDAAQTVELEMGGTGEPFVVPSGIHNQFVNPVQPLFPSQPTFPVTEALGVYTPEQLYPFTGVPSMGFDQSVQQGALLLNTAIMDQLAAGNNVVVLGTSQSADIASSEMQSLLALPTAEQPSADQLSFVLTASESAPNGGILARFDIPGDPVKIPSLGLSFDYSTPADTPWPTAIYDFEYDGFSDYPRYTGDLLSDLNAIEGILYVHTDTQFADLNLADAIALPVSADYTGHTQYFILPVEDLPLLDPLRQDGPLGNAVADLLQPILKPLVNLGYGNPDFGWSTAPANLETPVSLLPEPDMVLKAFEEAAAGVPVGIQNFMDDLGSLSAHTELIGNGASTTLNALPSLTDVLNSVNEIGSALSQLGTVTVQVGEALAITLPTYDIGLFAQELASGNLTNAIEEPIAVNIGADTLLGDFVWNSIALESLAEIVGALQSLIP